MCMVLAGKGESIQILNLSEQALTASVIVILWTFVSLLLYIYSQTAIQQKRFERVKKKMRYLVSMFYVIEVICIVNYLIPLHICYFKTEIKRFLKNYYSRRILLLR